MTVATRLCDSLAQAGDEAPNALMMDGLRTRIGSLAGRLALAAGLCAVAAAPAAEAACRLDGIAAMAVTMVGLRPMVHATLNGQDAVFLVDTGAFASVLSPRAAERYHIHVRGPASDVAVEGVAGDAYAAVARVEHLELGGASFFDHPFLVVAGAGRDVAGVLGQDILGQADAEYDLANGVIRLVHPKGCGQADVLSYWTDRPSVLRALPRLPREGPISAEGEINGQKIRVGFDSGSAYSGMTTKAAARAGITPSSPEAAPTRPTTGITGQPAPTWLAPFDRFSLGQEAVIHTRLRLGRTDLGSDDMLLGADFFLAHRIYVSRLQHRIYFTYNGGPVFRLRDSAALSWTVMGPAEGDPNAPVDAAGFARRGAASLARNAPEQAIEDFTHAIALQPQAAALYFDRGAAHAAGGQPDLALADFDSGLQLKPGDPSALLARAAVNIGAGRLDAARSDLDQALRGAGEDGLVGLEAATLYERAGFYGAALGAYDRWAAGNGHDELLSEALAGRCRMRALTRTALDLAARDCEAALKARRDDAGALASRALLRLAQGRFDLALADDDAALKTGERSFWALEGRGLAELGRGDRTQGEADLEAAAQVDSRQAERVRTLDLAALSRPPAEAGR